MPELKGPARCDYSSHRGSLNSKAGREEPNFNFETSMAEDRAQAKACWNPYRVGVGIGDLSWFAFGLMNQPLAGSSLGSGGELLHSSRVAARVAIQSDLPELFAEGQT